MLKKTIYIISLLLFNIFMLNADSSTTERELIIALNRGVKATEKFLEKVPTYQIYEYDKTILHYAVELDKYDIVEFLVSKNIELSRKGGIYYETALQDAIFYEHFRIARLLINSGTNLDVKNIDGDTALHIAAKNGYSDMVRLLLANGASKNIYNANGNTPYELVPNFMRDSSKKLKEMLKTEDTSKSKVKVHHNMGGAKFTLDEMDYGGASFILDEMNFDNTREVGEASSSSKSIEINIVDEDTATENSNIGDVIKSH
jgi:hypothetical protein